MELRDCQKAVDRLIGLQRAVHVLPAKYQKLTAEIVMLRLFDVFQHHLERIVCKVACGSSYLDGSSPQLLYRARSIAGAERAMMSHGRSPPLGFLRWSKAADVTENAKYVIASNDHVLVSLRRNGHVVDEMRRVRNRIAHSGVRARRDYTVVLRHHYGAQVRGVLPGTLLLSSRWNPTLLVRYLSSTKTLARELVRG